MVYTGHIKPVHKIIAAGKPLVQELKVENATNMYPGRLVKKGTADDDVVVSDGTDGGDIVGFLGYEQTAPVFRPSTVDTIYVINDQAAVLNGGGFVIVARLASGQTITKDDELTGAADGEVTAATIGTNKVIAYAEESVDAAGSALDIMVRSVI